MKKVFTLLTAFLTLFLTGCGDDDWTDRGSNSEREGFSLSYTIPGAIPGTRSTIDIEEGEDQVNSLHILFFEKEESGKYIFVDAIDAMVEYTTSLGSTGTLEIEFTEETSLTNAAEYKMLLCANIKDYTDAINNIDDIRNLCYGKEEGEVIENLWLTIEGVTGKDEFEEMTDTEHVMDMTNLPMSAMAIKSAKETEVRVDLVRMVSRFDVYLEHSVSGYELKSASIWNAYTEAPVWENRERDYTADRTQRYYGVSAADNRITGKLYAFENYVENPSQKDKQTTCLIIGLKNLQTDGIEYFRTNVHPVDMAQALRRNYVYHTTITGVENEGDLTEREAYENPQLNLTLDINGWTVDDYGNIQYEGENILAMPTREINLFSEGETRLYNIFAISPDPSLNLEMEIVNLPEGIEAELNGSELIVSATINDTGSLKSGTLRFSFAGMTAEINITQEFYEPADYLELNPYKLSPFRSEGGEKSALVTVSASGDWMAKIYNSGFDTFSFEEGNETFTMEGSAGESFNVYSLKENTKTESHFSFVVVKLKKDEYISRVILLEQKTEELPYLYLSPETVSPVSVLGGNSEVITINANDTWTATLTVEGNEAGFNGDVSLKEFSGSNTETFWVTFDRLFDEGVTPKAKITVRTDRYQLEESIIISQSPVSHGLLVYGNTLGVTTLVRADEDQNTGGDSPTNRNQHYHYVYNLGLTMRDRTLFGPRGVVPMAGPYKFVQQGFKGELFESANIYQAVSWISDTNDKDGTGSEVTRIQAAMAADEKKLLIVSHRGYDYPKKTFSRLGLTDYTVVSAGVGTDKIRYFNPDLDLSDPLVSYLVERGPFTDALIDVNNIQFTGKEATNAGLSSWPDTFIPLILVDASASKTYCVFGIDPVTRVIFLGDAFFGSNVASDKNSKNFVEANTENIAFMRNFVAWMTNWALYGDFLNYMEHYTNR